jgi:hypothetical protein
MIEMFLTWPSIKVVLFCEVNDLRCEVVVRFANIEGIVYHHCLKLLFIEMAIPQKFQ